MWHIFKKGSKKQYSKENCKKNPISTEKRPIRKGQETVRNDDLEEHGEHLDENGRHENIDNDDQEDMLGDIENNDTDDWKLSFCSYKNRKVNPF